MTTRKVKSKREVHKKIEAKREKVSEKWKADTEA